MKSDVYRLVTVNDGKSDSAAIVRVFSEMAEKRLKCDFSLLNYCEEVPISYGSTIIGVEKDSVELAVHEHQALIIKHDNGTLINSRHFHNDLGVHCYAAYVNIPKKTVILHNFAYAQLRASRREAVRVKVHEKRPVTFTSASVNLEGNMVDISGNGISITTDLVPTMNSDQSGLLSFTLNGTPLTVPGSFVRSTTKEADVHNYIFQMKPDRMSEGIIGRFIYQRPVEIINQLKGGLVGD